MEKNSPRQVKANQSVWHKGYTGRNVWGKIGASGFIKTELYIKFTLTTILFTAINNKIH